MLMIAPVPPCFFVHARCALAGHCAGCCL